MDKTTRAHVVNGVVVNIAVVDMENIPDHVASWVDATDLVIGMVDDGVGGFKVPDTPPEVATNHILKAYQFHAMIEEIGKDQEIRQAINDAYTGTPRRLAMNKLERGTQFHRNDPLVDAISAQLGLSSDAVDALWLQAKDF